MPATLAISALRVDFGGEEARESGGCLGHRLGAQRTQPLDQLGVLGGCLHGGIELGHEVGRHALGAPQGVPQHEVESRESRLGGRRHRRQLRGALLGHHREGAQGPSLHLLQGAAERGDHQRGLAADDVGEGGRRAAVGDDDRLDADAIVETHAGEVAHRAEPGVGVGVLVGGGLHLGGKRLEVGGGLGGVADEQHGRGGQPRDGREVRHRVVGHLAHDVPCHEMDVGIGQKCGAVGCGTRHLGGAQRVVGAGAVFHHPRLAERVLEAIGVEPADDIDVAAGRRWNDQADIAALLSGCRVR